MEIIPELWDHLFDIPPMQLLIPIALLWIITFIFGYLIVRRKGIGIFDALIGMFPFWAVPVLLWWVSLTDKEVLDRLDRLEGRR
jgi:hypothetical protein